MIPNKVAGNAREELAEILSEENIQRRLYPKNDISVMQLERVFLILFRCQEDV